MSTLDEAEYSGPIGHVVVVDERFEFAVRRFVRFDAVHVEFRANRPGKAAPSAPAAATTSVAWRIQTAGVLHDRAPPEGVVHGDLDRLLAIDEREGIERQRNACVRLLGFDGLRERGREFVVIEGRPLCLSRGVHDDKLGAALHRSPVPEAGRFLDPGRRLRHVDGQSLIFVAQPHRPLIIRDRSLRTRGSCRETQTREDGHGDGPADAHGIPLEEMNCGPSVIVTVPEPRGDTRNVTMTELHDSPHF